MKISERGTWIKDTDGDDETHEFYLKTKAEFLQERAEAGPMRVTENTYVGPTINFPLPAFAIPAQRENERTREYETKKTFMWTISRCHLYNSFTSAMTRANVFEAYTPEVLCTRRRRCCYVLAGALARLRTCALLHAAARPGRSYTHAILAIVCICSCV